MDESGFEATVERTHGWAPKGDLVYGTRSGKRGPRTSLIAARMRASLLAPLLFEGTCNTEVFNTWVEDMLCPILDDQCVVIMDNATFHKSKATQTLINNKGASVLFLPPYSPELNPIEHDFANLKRLHQFNQSKSIDEILNMYI